MAHNLDNYVTVAERLQQAGEQIQTIITEPPVMLSAVMGFIRATVGLKDGRSATGTASFKLDLPGKSAQATNPIEDCETSAVGRALGMLGYGSAKSIASREEVIEAERRRATSANGNGASFQQPPQCDICGATGRLGKDGKNYYCPNKDGHGGKWYTIKVAATPLRTIPDDWDKDVL